MLEQTGQLVSVHPASCGCRSGMGSSYVVLIVSVAKLGLLNEVCSGARSVADNISRR